jgi:hypothetical protein
MQMIFAEERVSISSEIKKDRRAGIAGSDPFY